MVMTHNSLFTVGSCVVDLGSGGAAIAPRARFHVGRPKAAPGKGSYSPVRDGFLYTQWLVPSVRHVAYQPMAGMHAPGTSGDRCSGQRLHLYSDANTQKIQVLENKSVGISEMRSLQVTG